jgi:hypothetical protein
MKATASAGHQFIDPAPKDYKKIMLESLAIAGTPLYDCGVGRQS